MNKEQLILVLLLNSLRERSFQLMIHCSMSGSYPKMPGFVFSLYLSVCLLISFSLSLSLLSSFSLSLSLSFFPSLSPSLSFSSVSLSFPHSPFPSCLLCLQLRVAVVEALGYCVHLLSANALNEQLPRLVPGVVQLYKKQSEHYYITQVHYSFNL